MIYNVYMLKHLKQSEEFSITENIINMYYLLRIYLYYFKIKNVFKTFSFILQHCVKVCAT